MQKSNLTEKIDENFVKKLQNNNIDRNRITSDEITNEIKNSKKTVKKIEGFKSDGQINNNNRKTSPNAFFIKKPVINFDAKASSPKNNQNSTLNNPISQSCLYNNEGKFDEHTDIIKNLSCGYINKEIIINNSKKEFQSYDKPINKDSSNFYTMLHKLGFSYESVIKYFTDMSVVGLHDWLTIAKNEKIKLKTLLDKIEYFKGICKDIKNVSWKTEPKISKEFQQSNKFNTHKYFDENQINNQQDHVMEFEDNFLNNTKLKTPKYDIKKLFNDCYKPDHTKKGSTKKRQLYFQL